MKTEWLNALGKLTYGIYVLTTRSGDEMNGMIASWVSQVSYEPPLVMAAVHPNRRSHGLLEKNPVFGLHVLDRSRADMLKRFKGPDPARKFDGIGWDFQQTGVPVLQDCLAWFEVQVKTHLSPGNHTIYIGELVNCGCKTGTDLLTTLDYDGMYTGKS